MIEITDDTFQTEVLDNPELVLVDAYTQFCGPCRAMVPILNNIEKIKVCKYNVSENSVYAKRYSVRVVPTFFFFKNGEIVERTEGSMSEMVLNTKINKHLGNV